MEKRAIHVIASEIIKDWKNPYFAVRPYLVAMQTLYSVSDKYGFESGRDVIVRFLANASTWRGDKAREIKEELKELLK